MLLQILQDALFAAIAAIGFSAISNPPKRAYFYCALLAAVGHSLRFVLMQAPGIGWHIIVASVVAAFIIGVLAVFLSPKVKTPAETCLFPGGTAGSRREPYSVRLCWADRSTSTLLPWSTPSGNWKRS